MHQTPSTKKICTSIEGEATLASCLCSGERGPELTLRALRARQPQRLETTIYNKFAEESQTHGGDPVRVDYFWAEEFTRRLGV